jgi:hypothetical protein
VRSRDAKARELAQDLILFSGHIGPPTTGGGAPTDDTGGTVTT